MQEDKIKDEWSWLSESLNSDKVPTETPTPPLNRSQNGGGGGSGGCGCGSGGGGGGGSHGGGGHYVGIPTIISLLVFLFVFAEVVCPISIWVHDKGVQLDAIAANQNKNLQPTLGQANNFQNDADNKSLKRKVKASKRANKKLNAEKASIAKET